MSEVPLYAEVPLCGESFVRSYGRGTELVTGVQGLNLMPRKVDVRLPEFQTPMARGRSTSSSRR